MRQSALARASLYERVVRETAASEPIAVPPCPVCDAESAYPRFAIDGMTERVVVCVRCGAGRVHPMPDAAAIASFYPPTYYGDLGSKFAAPIERLVRLVGNRHVRFLARDLPSGARILDVGCGRGVLLGALADRGFEAHGFEISDDAKHGADPRAEIRIAPDLAAAAYPDAHFDLVVVWHVLEHIPDPRAALAEIRRVIRPGGRLVVAVPNFASPQARWAGATWFHLDLPRHLHHFPLAALEQIVERSGFAVRSAHHFSLRQNPYGWIQSWMNRNERLPRNALYTLLQRRGSEAASPFEVGMRRRLLFEFGLLAAPALALTIAETALRSGGTVHIMATARD